MLEDRLNNDYKQALKEKDDLRVSTIRLVKSALKNYAIEKMLKTVSDEDVRTVIAKQVKQRQDSIQEYQKAKRADLAGKEERELSILQAYLPAQMSREELEKTVSQILSQNSVTSKAQMGLAMKHVMASLKGKADGNLIQQIVANKLSNT